MNNCLCETCCDKDYCLIYQDYKNPDGIITEPITACGRYKKLHTVEDTYTKEEVIAMLTEIQLEIEEYKSDRLVDMERDEMARIFSELVQQKIKELVIKEYIDKKE